MNLQTGSVFRKNWRRESRAFLWAVNYFQFVFSTLIFRFEWKFDLNLLVTCELCENQRCEDQLSFTNLNKITFSCIMWNPFIFLRKESLGKVYVILYRVPYKIWFTHPKYWISSSLVSAEMYLCLFLVLFTTGTRLGSALTPREYELHEPEPTKLCCYVPVDKVSQLKTRQTQTTKTMKN